MTGDAPVEADSGPRIDANDANQTRFCGHGTRRRRAASAPIFALVAATQTQITYRIMFPHTFDRSFPSAHPELGEKIFGFEAEYSSKVR
jgi:hypothetical protein